MRVVFGFAGTPFGESILGETARGICHLAFIDNENHAGALAELRSQWPSAEFAQDDTHVARLASVVFRHPADQSQHPVLRAFVRGSTFQVRVWNALLRVPFGALVTYGSLAAAIGQPNAARAVGSAVGSNTIGWLIPCHRVIRKAGGIGGYRWDPVRKSAMIAWEKG